MRHSRAPEMAFELLRLRRALRNVVTMAHHQHPSPNCGFDNIRGIARAALAPEKANGRKR
jgi:hypothetical protein